jgi:gliding motility-associatede transport system auxiliary component
MKVQNLLYSVVGVIAVAVILIAVNLLAGFAKVRSDLTQNRVYTLSDGTKKILQKLDTDVEIRFYYSRDNPAVPVPLRAYAQEVEDLLAEYQQYGHGKIKVVKLDPKPDSDAEDSANLDGIEGQNINLTDRIFLGLAVRCLDQKVAIPFLSPDRQTLLEYDLSRAISSVANPKKTVIGVMSALPVTGQKASPMMMRQRQPQNQPWVFLNELKQSFDIRDVSLTAEKIDDDISVLVVVHPQGISEQAEFAIDQFLMRGGKMVALLDPYSFVESQMAAQFGGGPTSSTFQKLLPAWGVQFSSDKVLADPLYATKIQSQESVQSDPTVLSLTAEAINQKDALGASINDLLIPFAGVFSGTPTAGLKEDVLVQSSTQAGLVSTMTPQLGGDAVRKELKSANTAYSIAIRLSGKFKTAFPQGKPQASKGADNPEASPSPSASTKADGATGSALPTPSPASNVLKEGTAEGVVILIGDSDFAYDAIAGRTAQAIGQTVFIPSNGNLNFIQSCVEQLAGDSNLIGVRSRATGNRPFERVNRMEAAAQEKYQGKIAELEDSLNQTRQKLTELQTGKQADQKTLLSPEQQAEIKKFHENEANVNRELKQVRKDLRGEIDSLQNNLKWINIAGMPLLVTVAGLLLAWMKRTKRAAR